MRKTIRMPCIFLVTLDFVGGRQDRQEVPSSGKTIAVRGTRGKAEIPAEPRCIVDLSGDSDILSLLGYSIVSAADSDAYNYTQLPTYPQESLQGAKTPSYSMQDTMGIEGILEPCPNLVVISGVQERMHERLKKIVLTLVVELVQTD